jgi:hypothetical protein
MESSLSSYRSSLRPRWPRTDGLFIHAGSRAEQHPISLPHRWHPPFVVGILAAVASGARPATALPPTSADLLWLGWSIPRPVPGPPPPLTTRATISRTGRCFRRIRQRPCGRELRRPHSGRCPPVAGVGPGAGARSSAPESPDTSPLEGMQDLVDALAGASHHVGRSRPRWVRSGCDRLVGNGRLLSICGSIRFRYG